MRRQALPRQHGRFADNGFIDTKSEIAICGAGAHHPNGIIKNETNSNPRSAHPPISRHVNMARTDIFNVLAVRLERRSRKARHTSMISVDQ